MLLTKSLLSSVIQNRRWPFVLKLSRSFGLALGVLLPPFAAAVEPLQEVVVTASRVPVPLAGVGAAVEVITAADIATQGMPSVTDLLRRQTAIGVSNQGGAGKVTTLRIRGEEGYRTLFLIDGVEMTDVSAPQPAAKVQFLGDGIGLERIEILRGPQGFAHGADAGGIVALFTKAPRAPSAELTAETGSFNSHKLAGFVAAGGERGGASLLLNRLESDGINAHQDDSSFDEDGYSNTTLHAKAEWQASEQWQLKAVARSVDVETEYDQCGWPTVNDCLEKTRQKLGRMEFAYADDDSRQSFALASSSADSRYYAQGQFSYLTDGEIRKAEYLGAQEFSPLLHLVWGGDYKTERLASDQLDERHQTGVYLESRSAWEETVFFSAGVRFDDNNAYGEHLSTRLSAAYLNHLTNAGTLKYRASFGTGFRPPSLYELAYNRGPYASGEALTVELTEERSRGIDVGVQWYTAGGFEAGIGYFRQTIDDEIYYDLVTDAGYLQSDEQSQSEGVELEVEWPLARAVRLLANYTFNDTRTRDDERRVRRPRQLGNIGVEFQLLAERCLIWLNVRGAADIDDVNGEDLPDYAVLDASVRYALGADLHAYLRIENALDKDYVEVANYNTSGSAAYGGLEFRF